MRPEVPAVSAATEMDGWEHRRPSAAEPGVMPHVGERCGAACCEQHVRVDTHEHILSREQTSRHRLTRTDTVKLSHGHRQGRTSWTK